MKLDGSLKYNGQTKSRHQRHEDFNLVFTNHGKRGWNIPSEDKKCPLKRDSKSTNNDQ
jgi:hypothetical protein